jgi:hypothetical protein
MLSHASSPFGTWMENGHLRVYCTSRDALNRSHIVWVDLDPQHQFAVDCIGQEPVLEPGEAGLFDDSGVAMGCLLTIAGVEHLYYLGWNLKVTVPWLNSIGLAVQSPGANRFVKYSRAPILDRSNEDPFSISYPSVLLDEGVYRMWYGSNLRWGKTEREMDHVIKYGESSDGIHWRRSGDIAVALEHPNEYALSKPLVLKRGAASYVMYYSYRGNGEISSYRIGHAVSKDGYSWSRRDADTGIDVSPQGWDSEMICYPFVFDYLGHTYMLYNGNGYGRTGFGLAKLQDHV